MYEIEDEIEQARQTAAERAAERGSGQDGGEKPEEPKKPLADVMDWVSSIIVAVAAMLVLNLFVFRSITVSGPSMLDTLEDGDQVIATNFFYTPKFGDIVVIQANKLKHDATDMWGEPIIKRVIGVGGDTIRINFDKGEVYLNGELLEEDYIKDLTFFRHDDTWIESDKEYTVPENTVFVMGDNRAVSNDSRNLPQVGFVDTSFIMGRAFVCVSPSEHFKWL